MIKKISFLLLIIFLSCSKDSETKFETIGNNHHFELRYKEIHLKPVALDTMLSLSSNAYWQVESKPDWISVDPENGTGDEELRISVSDNMNSDLRRGEVIFSSFGRDFSLWIQQQTGPLRLVSHSGIDGDIKMNEKKFLLFNKAVTFNTIYSGDETYSFHIDPNDIEYFDNNHGIRFSDGPSTLGRIHKYNFRVTDNDGNPLEGSVDMQFYSQKVELPGSLQKVIPDDENNLWALTSGESSYIIKLQQNEDGYEETLRFEVDIAMSSSGGTVSDFFINPFNDLIYLPDGEGEEVDVYTKDGSIVKQITIPPSPNDHPEYPHSSPIAIGFNKYGKGIITLRGKDISGMRWRFIDSAQDDLLEEPGDNYSISLEFKNFQLGDNNSSLYFLEDESSSFRVLGDSESIDQIPLGESFPNFGEIVSFTPNKLNNKLLIGNPSNRQIIISPDLVQIGTTNEIRFQLGDFCYDPGLSNHVYALDRKSDNSISLQQIDFNTGNILFDNPTNHTYYKDIITTSDDKYLVIQSQGTTLTIYRTEMFK